MNSLNRALLSIIRKPGKAMTLLLFVFLLGILLSGAISVRHAIHNTEANLRAQMPAITTLYWNPGANQGADWEYITIEVINQLGKLPYVKDYDFTNANALFSRDLEWVKPPIDQDLLPDSIPQELAEGAQSGLRDWGGYMEIFRTRGINNPNPVDQQIGLISLVAGRFMTQEELDQGALVAVVSRLFAEVNELGLASTILLENNVYDQERMFAEGSQPFLSFHLEDYLLGSQLLAFEIIGIFDVEREPIYPEIYMIRLETELHNQIYVPSSVNEKMAKFIVSYRPHFFGHAAMADEALLETQAFFVLHDPRDLSAFAEAAVSILPEHWHVSDASGAFSPITSSMDTMLWLSQLIFWGTAVATITILSLLITLFLRDRRYEMGLYRALGAAKSKIMFQILIEISMISIVAMILALVVGSILSSSMSRQLLAQDLMRQEQEHSFDGFSEGMYGDFLIFDPGAMSVEEMLAAYDTSLTTANTVIFFSIQVVVILFSTIIPSVYIMRLEPKKILL